MLSQSLRRASKSAGETSRRHVHSAPNELLSLLIDLKGAEAGSGKRPRTAGSDMRRVQSASKQVLSGMKQSNNPSWKHTYGRSKESQRLRQDVLQNASKQRVDESVSVFESSSVESMSIEDMMLQNQPVVTPGTYFEMRRNTESVTGVVLREAQLTGKSHNILALTPKGESATLRSSDIMFAIPYFADANLIQRCGAGVEHANEHELAARLRVLQSIKTFEREVEKEQFRFGRDIKTIYEKTRSKNPNEWGKTTTMQVARMLNSSPNVPVMTLYAVHKQLMDRSNEFLCHPNRHRFVHSFDVRPRAQIDVINQVSTWSKERDPVIAKFQDKARRLIDISRRIREEHGDESPSVAGDEMNETFTKDEQLIIEFLKLHVVSRSRNTQVDPFELHVPVILKDMKRYGDELITAFLSLTFLREIGVWTPWEDIASKSRDLYLSNNVYRDSGPAGSTVATTTPGLLTQDAHEGVRHDFGDMPVYVIDDASAEELDDGVSVERIPNESDCVWLHTHVADPTALIPITHPLSRAIQKRPETLYLGHKSYPMLPPDIGKLADMGRSNVPESGQNVLTFSAKIDSKGQILDYKIRAGRVKNVVKLTYDAVDELLGFDNAPSILFPFERSVALPAKPDISNLQGHVENLKLAFSVTRSLIAERFGRNNFNFSTWSPRINFLDKPVPESLETPSHPVLYRGYPRLQYSVEDGRVTEQGSRSLVSESMKLAGRISSRFCTDHNIPAIRRTMPPPRFTDPGQLPRILAARDSHALVDVVTLAREGISFQMTNLTMEPAAHFALGIPEGEGYVRTTSPLRRADDMLMHWQIKNALLPASASAGGAGHPLISTPAMARIVEELSSSFFALRSASRAHVRQWSFEYILRFMEQRKREGDGDGSAPNPLREMEGTVVTGSTYNLVLWEYYQDVLLPSLGLKGFLPLKSGQKPYEMGTKLKVNVSKVFQHDLNHNLMLELA